MSVDNGTAQIADLPAQMGLLAWSWKVGDEAERARSMMNAVLNEQDFVGIDRELFICLQKASASGRFDYLHVEPMMSEGAKARFREFDPCVGALDWVYFNDMLKQVVDHSKLRRLKTAATSLHRKVQVGKDPEQLGAEYINTVIDILNRGHSLKTMDIDSAVDKALDIEEQWNAGEKYHETVPTGFSSIDRVTGGMHRGHVTTIGGVSGVGKTQWALQIARNVALRAKSEGRDGLVYIFSMEMTEEKLVQRLAQCASGIPTDKLKNKEATPEERVKWRKAASDLKGLSWVIDPEIGLTTAQMAHRVTAHSATKKHGVDLVVLDYIELPEEESKHGATQKIDDIVRGLKKLAKQHNCAVLALSQLSNSVENRQNRRPRLSDLRMSSTVRNLSQAVLMCYYPDKYREKKGKGYGYPNKDLEQAANGLADLGANYAMLVEKNRDGPEKKMLLHMFDGPITRISEVTDTMSGVKARMRGKG